MHRGISGWGTVVVALVGLWVAPMAGAQLVLLALTTALAVGAGAEAHARLHPRFGPIRARLLDGFWIGPALAVLAAALVAAQLDGVVARLAQLVGAGLVGALLYVQDRELDHRDDDRWALLAHALLLYTIAFPLFVVLYGGRQSAMLAALGTGASAMLLAAALYRPSGAPPQRVWLYAGLTGLCVGQLTLALSTWVGLGLIGGAFLLLFLYVADGLIQSLLDGSLDARLLVEYSVVGLVGLTLILLTSPWRL